MIEEKRKKQIEETTEQLVSIIRDNYEEPSSEAVAIAVLAATLYEALDHIG